MNFDGKESEQKGNKFRKVNQFKKMKGGSKTKRDEDDIKSGSNVCKYCGKQHKEELPGMPSDQEIDFTIDLIPGVVPILK
ncbi:hypothetical protein AgCh_030963 [Apium graveolens]